MKKFIIRIAYEDYAVESKDGMALLEIASRMQRVKQNGYSGPYYVQPDQDPWIDQLIMAEVEIPEEAVDKFTAATREIPF